MKITNLIAKKSNDLFGEKIPTVAFLGDSVTQGCFALYMKNERDAEAYYDKESAYHLYFSKILSLLYPRVPINIINAGIGGGRAKNGLERLERDVLCHHPDLTVVCFGLNDSRDNIDVYYNSLKGIFKALKENGSEVIFMTPNMMNTKISCHLKDKPMIDIAEETMKRQNDGVLEEFVNIGKTAAREENVVICDVYSKWKALCENGVDTTELLANKINHPNEKMNWLFAYSLIETIMQN